MRPQNVLQKSFDDIPLMHIKQLTMYELNQSGVTTVLKGSEAFRYENERYTVDHIDATDNSKEHVANLKANFGVYNDDTLDLNGNVTYTRDDGLQYKTQKAFYYYKNELFVTDTAYTLTQGENRVEGSYLDYNNITGKIHSKNIEAQYTLDEGQ